MADHDSTTGRTETLDDWLKEWALHDGWKPAKVEAQRLVDEIVRLRTREADRSDIVERLHMQEGLYVPGDQLLIFDVIEALEAE